MKERNKKMDINTKKIKELEEQIAILLKKKKKANSDSDNIQLQKMLSAKDYFTTTKTKNTTRTYNSPEF